MKEANIATDKTVKTPTVNPNTDEEVAGPSKENRGGMIVLQWLTYSFWFGLVVSVSWLATSVFSFLSSGQSSSVISTGLLAYALSSVIIMSICTFLTDYFYSKYEPVKKTKVAYVVMLIHLIPFILVIVGSLIFSLFFLLTMLLGGGDSLDGVLVALTMAVLLTIVSVRVFLGGRAQIRLVSKITLAVAVVGFVIAGIVGPVANSVNSRNDRLIEKSLYYLNSSIQKYARENNKLPENLRDVSIVPGTSTQELIDSNLVSYKPNTLPAESSNPLASRYKTHKIEMDKFYYQLCVNYQAKSGSSKYYEPTSSSYNDKADGYSSYISTVNHPAGEVCYKLYTDTSTY